MFTKNYRLFAGKSRLFTHLDPPEAFFCNLSYPVTAVFKENTQRETPSPAASVFLLRNLPCFPDVLGVP